MLINPGTISLTKVACIKHDVAVEKGQNLLFGAGPNRDLFLWIHPAAAAEAEAALQKAATGLQRMASGLLVVITKWRVFLLLLTLFTRLETSTLPQRHG